MRENGPEPIIVQIKESLRSADELDERLDALAARQRQEGVRIVKRWAGSKFLIMLSFPANFTEERALAVIARLQQSPAVEKVVAQSAFNRAMQRARDSNMVVVCAAGNEVNDNDDTEEARHTPSTVPTDNLISVLATNRSR